MLRATLFFGLVMFALAIGFLSSASSAPAAGAERQATRGEYSTVAYFPGYRICCKRGWHDWWSTPRECRRAGGYRVANWECRHDVYDYRICCKRGRHDWWSTPRECRRAGGYQVSGWYCRHD